jgi:hypothetical protein
MSLIRVYLFMNTIVFRNHRIQLVFKLKTTCIKILARVVFIFSSKTRVLVWCGLKLAENGPKTSYVFDPLLSLGENVRFQK